MTDLNTSIRRRQLKPIKQDDLDATNTPTDGQVAKVNMPAGDFTYIDIASVTSATYTTSFVNADLSSAGVMVITHNLGVTYPLVFVYDNSEEWILPTFITYVDNNTVHLDFAGMTPLIGTYNVRINGSGGNTGDSISDADNDTKVEVEKNADEDIIRFTSLAVQRAQIDVNGLKLQSGADVTEFSIDGTLAGNSDDAVPTEKAVKTYIDGEITPLVSDISKNETNIVLNAFRIAVNGSLTQFNMVDGIVDEYEDESGISHIPVPFCHMAMEDNTDDGTGANAVTNIGTPTYTSGKLNNALTLDGSTDALNLDTLMSDITSDTTGTISFWLKPNTLDYITVSFSDTDGLTFISLNAKASSEIYARDGSNVYLGSFSSGMTTGNWYHYCLVQDGIEPRVFINGEEKTITWSVSNDLTFWFADSANFDNASIGVLRYNSTSQDWFDGQLDDFRYYQNKALTASEVALIYNLGTGTEDSEIGSQSISYNSTDDYYSPESLATPFAHYKLNDNLATTNVIDTGTGSNDGTCSVNTSALSVAGKINEAFEFNGSSEYINLDVLATDIASDTEGTILFWFNTTVSVGTIFSINDTSADEQIMIYKASSTVLRILIDDFSTSGNQVYWDITVSSSAIWQHVAFVQNGTSLKIYLNSSDVTPASSGSLGDDSWFATLNGLDNGRFASYQISGNPNGNFYAGKIDDFRYCQGVALTQEEIAFIYNSGTGTESSDFATNMTLISDTFTAEAQPDIGRIVLFTEDIDSIILDTDLILKISRDSGTTYSTAILENVGEYESGKNILTASVDISGQPAGTNIKYKLETANNKNIRIHGTGMSWD